MFKRVVIVGMLGLLAVGGMFGGLVLAGNYAVRNVTVETSFSGPDAVVDSFYSWYLDNVGYDAESGTFRNPLVERAYAGREELSRAFVAEVDALLSSFEEGASGYDPFLCAQDIPTKVSVTTTEVVEDTAEVTVETSFSNHNLRVLLETVDGEWLISDIECVFE